MSDIQSSVTDDLKRYGQALESDAQQVTDDVVELMTETNDFVRGQMIVRPYVTLGAAAGVGYLFGAGIPRWAARMAIGFLARTMAAYLYSGAPSHRDVRAGIGGGAPRKTAAHKETAQ